VATLDFLAAAAPAAVRVTDVAGHRGLSQATASRLLATLADTGYAADRQGPDDGRARGPGAGADLPGYAAGEPERRAPLSPAG
jgi:hypothetical protein